MCNPEMTKFDKIPGFSTVMAHSVSWKFVQIRQITRAYKNLSRSPPTVSATCVGVNF